MLSGCLPALRRGVLLLLPELPLHLISSQDLLLQILDFEIEHILLDEVIFRQDRLHRFAQRVLHRRLALADRLL